VNLAEFAALVRAHDGVDAFNEESRLAFAVSSVGRASGRVHTVVMDGDVIVAAAHAGGDAPIELAVHPAHRRRGHATALLDGLLARGERKYWAHGDLDGARALAGAAGLEPARTLLRLRRPGTVPVPVTPAADAGIRPFRPADVLAVLAVNGRAFADHPEQGALDLAGFEARTQAAWFDPAGLLVAERAGEVVGFHWTKVEDGIGEVYVLAVDPHAQGLGIATSLLAAGLAHLRQRGVPEVDLYVEADNSSAIALYARFGFVEESRDVLYVSTTPAAGDRDPA
jgi:mycothiol synthase